MKQKLMVIYINISLICVLLVGLELGGQIAFYAWKGYPVYRSQEHQANHELFELHPFLVGRLRGGIRVERGGTVVTSTPEHTRWTGADPANAGAIRVAVIGGSTTFGAGVTDTDSWPARLQHALGDHYAVTNFGMPGFSTAESVIQMALLVPETRPQVIVLYEGWNDLHNFHQADLGPDYYSHGLRQYGNLAIELPKPPSLMSRLADVSAICHFAAVITKSAARARPASGAMLAEATPDSFVDRIYLRNLRTLHLLAEQTGAYVILVPQVLDLSRFTGDSSYVWTPRIRNDAMPTLLHRYEVMMDSVCGPSTPRCSVLHEAARYSWTHDDFIDEGHFSGRGGEAFSGLLATRILALVNASTWRQEH